MQDTAKNNSSHKTPYMRAPEKICTQCCDTEVPPLITCTRLSRCTRNARASDEASQLTSDHHSRAQMIVPIPEFRHIATENMHFACVASGLLLTETPASITPHVCERGRSKQAIGVLTTRMQLSINTTKPINSAAGPMSVLKQADRSGVSRQNKQVNTTAPTAAKHMLTTSENKIITFELRSLHYVGSVPGSVSSQLNELVRMGTISERWVVLFSPCLCESERTSTH